MLLRFVEKAPVLCYLPISLSRMAIIKSCAIKVDSAEYIDDIWREGRH